MTKEQLKKFIKLRNLPGCGGAMQDLLDAGAAGFRFSDLPKQTLGDGSYPTETPYGIVFHREGKLVLRDFTPEETAERAADAARLASMSTKEMTWRELERFIRNMTPAEHDKFSREMAKGLEANRAPPSPEARSRSTGGRPRSTL